MFKPRNRIDIEISEADYEGINNSLRSLISTRYFYLDIILNFKQLTVKLIAQIIIILRITRAEAILYNF